MPDPYVVPERLYRRIPFVETEPLDLAWLGPPANGYDVVILPEGAPIDFSAAARFGIVTTASVSFAPGAAGTRWAAYVRARKGTLASDPVESPLRLASDGSQLLTRPNAPQLIAASPAANGDVELTWLHDDVGAAVQASSFKVFGDAGVGRVDYTTVLATLSSSARRVVVSGLQQGIRQLLAVQAFSAAGISDGNGAALQVVPRDTPPPGLSELVAVQTA